ncbi:MAG: helix-turn-helix transcriptional regulator [Maribacter sp.]|nr:helix-turn-helix transcriptional regulator [Maribacter sp.]
MKTRIKELRTKHDLIQEGLAKRGIARRETIVFLEKGKHNLSLQLAFEVSKVFNLKIERVFIF